MKISNKIPDIDAFTRDFLNISKTGIVSGEQSILAELMFYHMAKTNEEATSEIKQKTQALDKVTEDVIKELNRLGYTGSKTFDLFFEKVDGKETGRLISQISKTFTDSRNDSTKKYWKEIKGLWKTYYNTSDKTMRKTVLSDITKAQNNIDEWYRNNTVTLDIRSLEDLWSMMSDDVKDFYKDFQGTPDNAHKQEIIDLVGQEEYTRLLKEQLQKLEEYIASETVSFENMESNMNIQNLEDTKKYYKYRNNPFYGASVQIDNNPVVVDGNAIEGVQGMNYLVHVPKNMNGYYDENYKTIISNPTLNSFYTEVSELLQKLYAVLPPDQKNRIDDMTLPLFKQSFSEMLLDKNLSAMTTDMWDGIIDVLTDKENRSTSVDMIDPVTGKRDIRYNYSGLGISERKILVSKREKLLYSKFVADNNREPTMAEFTDIEAQAQHDVATDSSHDIGKILKLFTAYVTMAEHKEKVIPTLTILQKEFEKIKAAETTNIFGIRKTNKFGETETSGERENANKQVANQMDFFMNRPVNLVELPLSEKKTLSATEKKKVSEIQGIIDSMDIPEQYKKMDSADLTRAAVDVEIDIKNMTDPSDIKEQKKLLMLLQNAAALKEQSEDEGSYKTGSGLADAGLRFIQLKSLGWNLPSQLGNLLAGLWSNLITAADGRYFSSDNYMYGLRQMFYSSLKLLTFNQINIGTADKTRALMDRFDILQTPTSELFKASVGNVSGKFQNFSPYELIRKTEYFNQSPLVIAKLRETEIFDKDGNKSTVWNAINEEGNLREEFRTENNMQWETGSGKDVNSFKLAMEDIIRQTHGDYSSLSRMRIKKYALGRMLTQFKTFLPEAINSRFGNERTSLLTGVTTKGRYRSYSKGGGALFGAAVGTAVLPLIGTAIGGGIGYFLANNKTDMSFGQDLVFNMQQVLRKMLLMKTKFDDKFSPEDAALLRQNAQELQLIMILFAMYLMTKVFLFDDDDEKDSARRLAHNIIINNLLRQSSDLQLFSNPFEMSKMGQNLIPMFKLLDNSADLFTASGKLITGEDTYEKGPLAGESRMANKLSKFVPVIFSLQLVPDWQKDKVLNEPLIGEAFKDE